MAQTSQERRHRVGQSQSAGLFRALAKCSVARAYDGSARRVGVIDHRIPHDVSKIELTIAVCIGTRKLEESSCRWIQLMRLGCWRVGTGPFEAEIEPKLLNTGERPT